MATERPQSQATLTYHWPSKDPLYWQALVEYVIEADNEGEVPETFGDFVRDLALWVEGWTRDEGHEEIHRVKVFSPDENDLIGNALYSHMELNEDIEGDFTPTPLEAAEEREYNQSVRTLVEREWPIIREGEPEGVADAGATD